MVLKSQAILTYKSCCIASFSSSFAGKRHFQGHQVPGLLEMERCLGDGSWWFQTFPLSALEAPLFGGLQPMWFLWCLLHFSSFLFARAGCKVWTPNSKDLREDLLRQILLTETPNSMLFWRLDMCPDHYPSSCSGLKECIRLGHQAPDLKNCGLSFRMMGHST